MISTCLLAAVLVAADERSGAAADIATLIKPSGDPTANRAAWDRLVGRGPDALLPILRAWPADPVAANWLRTAFDRIAKGHPGALPLDALLAFASDARADGNARRAALAAVDRERPGTAAKKLAGWLSDPEFGPDAAAERLAAADAATDPAEQLRILRDTLEGATDLEQSVTIARRLAGAGEKPDVRKQLGIVSEWHVVGPFPVSPEDGLKKSFPPEEKADLSATFDGRNGKLNWLAAANDPLDGRLDVVKRGVKPDDGAVAYAAATVVRDKPAKVELRASAVDNVTVWVNGKKVLERASEYRSMFRPDRYRAPVELPAGASVVLVKLTKTKAEEVRGKPDAPAKWDFLVRLVGAEGRAVTFTQPGGKK